MQSVLSVCSLTAVVFLPTVTNGDDAKNATSQPPEWFSRLDRDSNGILDEKEAGRFLTLMDADKDGKVTVDEAVAWSRTRRRSDRRANGRRRAGFTAEELESREKTGDGLWVVTIGHSCVVSAVGPFSEAAARGGYENHTQVMQFFGGGGGAPKAQWSRKDETLDARPALRSGKMDVMSFGHLVDFHGRRVGCEVEDYERWIQFALEHNPDIRFFIQDLWPWLPMEGRQVKFEDFNLEAYEAAMADQSESLGKIVDELNRKYEDRVRVIPVGPAMVELVRRVTNNELPEVDAVVVPPTEAGERAGLYRDQIHATNVTGPLQGYIYYACLYGKNPMQFDTGIYPDEKLDRILRELAWNTVVRHPHSGVTE